MSPKLQLFRKRLNCHVLPVSDYRWNLETSNLMNMDDPTSIRLLLSRLNKFSYFICTSRVKVVLDKEVETIKCILFTPQRRDFNGLLFVPVWNDAEIFYCSWNRCLRCEKLPLQILVSTDPATKTSLGHSLDDYLSHCREQRCVHIFVVLIHRGTSVTI